MIRRLFVPARLDQVPIGTRVIAYGLLGLWTLVVLFPLYWMAITSRCRRSDLTSSPRCEVSPSARSDVLRIPERSTTTYPKWSPGT